VRGGIIFIRREFYAGLAGQGKFQFFINIFRRVVTACPKNSEKPDNEAEYGKNSDDNPDDEPLVRG
jgi:hypothetical protein